MAKDQTAEQSNEAEDAELARLIAEDEAAKAAPKAKKVKTVAVKLNRSHWIGEERHDAPKIVDVEPAEARRLIDAGVASRTDPLPGE